MLYLLILIPVIFVGVYVFENIIYPIKSERIRVLAEFEKIRLKKLIKDFYNDL